MKNPLISVAFVFLAAVVVVASEPEDRAADAVAAAFIQAREAAHLPALNRMDGNPFRNKVCKHDLSFASGLINTAQYQTSEPARLPGAAQRLATSRDSYKVAVRFGVGVCSAGSDSLGRPTYSVLIATYESRWTSFWRIFWE